MEGFILERFGFCVLRGFSTSCCSIKLFSSLENRHDTIYSFLIAYIRCICNIYTDIVSEMIIYILLQILMLISININVYGCSHSK